MHGILHCKPSGQGWQHIPQIFDVLDGQSYLLAIVGYLGELHMEAYQANSRLLGGRGEMQG